MRVRVTDRAGSVLIRAVPLQVMRSSGVLAEPGALHAKDTIL